MACIYLIAKAQSRSTRILSSYIRQLTIFYRWKEPWAPVAMCNNTLNVDVCVRARSPQLDQNELSRSIHNS
jgi:hypothetical protein